MSAIDPAYAEQARSRPIHAVLIPIAAALFLATLVTDLLYLWTVQVQWETFSIWLLTLGLFVAGISGIALLYDLLGRRRLFRPAWAPLIAAVVGAVLELFNAFIHSRDGYTAVVPQGLILSAVVAVIVVFMGLSGWNLSLPSHAASAGRAR